MLPPDMSASLMQEAMTPIEWSVMKSTLDLFREVGSEEALKTDGLSITSLAAVLADVWFYPTMLDDNGGMQMVAADSVGEPFMIVGFVCLNSLRYQSYSKALLSKSRLF